MTRYRTALAATALILLAGCAGVSPPSAGTDTGACGEAAFVLSGQTNRIGDFAHLNVTVTRVELKRKSASEDRKRVTRDIEDRRIDLAQRRGEKITLLANASIPNGTYKKAFLSVTNVTGTLTDGTRVDVSVRRDRLKVKKRFEVSGDEAIRFTVDPTVVRRDGQYVLKPLIYKSGCSCC